MAHATSLRRTILKRYFHGSITFTSDWLPALVTTLTKGSTPWRNDLHRSEGQLEMERRICAVEQLLGLVRPRHTESHST